MPGRDICSVLFLWMFQWFPLDEPLSQEEQLRRRLHGLNPERVTIPTVGHDRGSHQGVAHGVKQGGGLQAPLPREVWHRGSAYSYHNHAMDGECSGHSGHDDGSTVDGGATARLPFEQWCARQEGQRAQARAWQPSAKQKAAQWWNKLVGKQTTTIAPSHESPWHEPLLEAERTLIVDFASTHARAKGVASSTSHEGGGAARGYGSQAPECLTSTHDRWGGQVVPSTSGDPCHRYHITSGVRPLALS
jgi:hypothetical protein